MNRKLVLFSIKLLFSLGVLGWVYYRLLSTTGADQLWQHISHLAWGWLWLGFAMQLLALGCSVLRWQRLLVGQGIHAPLRHLLGSFMIGRLFGEFTPGGWTGLNAYRIYDVAKYTGKLARAGAAVGVEMVLGWLSFGAVVVASSLFGMRFIGATGVAMVDAFFMSLIALALLLVSRPTLFRHVVARLPSRFATKLESAVEAVCAYQGQHKLIVQAVLLGIGTHGFRGFIYVASARALDAHLGVGEVFFGSALQVFATFLPASVNGIGLREATAVALYTRAGVPESTAVLIPTLGFLMEVTLSSLGCVPFLLRRSGYQVEIPVDAELPDAGEQAAAQRAAAIGMSGTNDAPTPPRSVWPSMLLGLGAGLLAGAAVGCAEAWVTLRGSAARPDYQALPYGAAFYAVCIGLVGAGIGLASGLWRRVRLGALARGTRPQNAPRSHHRHAGAGLYARIAAGLFASLALLIGAFRVRRDHFHEVLSWTSTEGLLVLAGCLATALASYGLLAIGLRLATQTSAGSWLLRPWGSPLAVGAFIAVLALSARIASSEPAQSRTLLPRPAAPAGAGNILFVVVDTLRADHLPSYGYASGSTPALERFAQDAVRFEAAYANASWTRPSFASILTGRFAASHRTMAKNDALPDEIITLPEALRGGGYDTLGVVTNYNIAPFFHFDQGFDQYRYLEPNFVLGAGDTAAKLLLVQALRHKVESFRARHDMLEVGSAYQDAATVNRAVLQLLPKSTSAPFFAFVAYMDPHDPYYPHGRPGSPYSRSAHPRPDEAEAAHLIELYDGEITYWDQHFGALLDELRRRGLYDALTVVVTADHGEEFFEHGGFWHGTTLYDEALHVPLFIKLPHNRLHGSVEQQPVQLIDLMPSLLKLVGLPVPAGVQGQDLWNEHDRLLAEESLEGNVLRSLRLVRSGSTLKLIEANPGNPRGLAPRELYQLDRDPLEQVEVSGEEAELLTLGTRELADQQRSAAEGRATQRNVDVAADSTATERLRALGYAGGEKTH